MDIVSRRRVPDRMLSGVVGFEKWNPFWELLGIVYGRVWMVGEAVDVQFLAVLEMGRADF